MGVVVERRWEDLLRERGVPCGGPGRSDLPGLTTDVAERLTAERAFGAEGTNRGFFKDFMQCAGATAASSSVAWGRERKNEEIVNLVVHTTEGSWESAVGIAKGSTAAGFRNQGWDLLTDQDRPGVVLQCNDWNRYCSHHAGHWPTNRESIGWETRGFAAQSGRWSEEYYKWMGRVRAELRKLFPNIPMKQVQSWRESGDISHRRVYITALNDFQGRWDPGDGFRWDLLYKWANFYLRNDGGGIVVPALKPAEYNILDADTKWSRPRAELVIARLDGKVKRWTKAAEIEEISQQAYDSTDQTEPFGRIVAMVAGNRALGLISDDAASVADKFGPEDSDIWVMDSDEDFLRYLAVVDRREGTKLADAYRKAFKIAPAPPPTGEVEAIDRFFAESGVKFGMAYEPLGQVVSDVADACNLHITMACAIVEQESWLRNVLGCDHGRVGDRPPYCNQPVTQARVQGIRQGGSYRSGMNGIGPPQCTWWEFVERAERLGGAHIPKNTLTVCFTDLVRMFERYSVEEALGRYNAGGGWQAVQGSYVRPVLLRQKAWRSRLGYKERSVA